MIDHEHLLTLLHDEYGVCGIALSRFRTYLEDRTHCVKIDSKTSATIPLQSGVPQGSVLGPVMFTLYTTPLQRIFKRHGIKHHKYADDIQLYASYNPATSGDQVKTARRLANCIGAAHAETKQRKNKDDDLYIKTSSQDVRRLLLDNRRGYGFTIRSHKEFGSSHGSTSDDDRSCDCCVCRM